MDEKIFYSLNFSVAMVLTISCFLMLDYGKAANYSMFYLLATVGSWVGARFIRQASSSRWPFFKGYKLFITGTVISFGMSFLILHLSHQAVNTIIGRIIFFNPFLFNALFLAIYLKYNLSSKSD